VVGAIDAEKVHACHRPGVCVVVVGWPRRCAGLAHTLLLGALSSAVANGCGSGGCSLLLFLMVNPISYPIYLLAKNGKPAKLTSTMARFQFSPLSRDVICMQRDQIWMLREQI